MSNTARPDFSAAPQAVLPRRGRFVASATASLIDLGGIDANQVLAYDLAHAAAAVATARASSSTAALGELEARTAGAFVAECWSTWPNRTLGRDADWASGATGWAAAEFVRAYRDPPSWPTWPVSRPPSHLDPTSSSCARPFNRLPRRRSGPTPSMCTARTGTSPEEIIEGLASSVASGFGPRGVRRLRHRREATTSGWCAPPRS